MKHTLTALDRFFLAVPWDRMMINEDGQIRLNSRSEDICPIDAAGGDYTLADGGLGLDLFDRISIMNAADNDDINEFELRQKMEQLILGHQLAKMGR